VGAKAAELAATVDDRLLLFTAAWNRHGR